jgi:hypothetical protein
MLELFIVLVLASLRVRIRWERINGRLRLKSIRVDALSGPAAGIASQQDRAHLERVAAL